MRKLVSPFKISHETREEVAGLLSNLIRIDTTNPPGNEAEAAEFLATNLEKEGFTCETCESKPGRGNVITRMIGTERKPSLLLLSHLDVVAANPKEWNVDPFGGEIKDGFVWGRGALDMKSMTAIEAAVMKLLKRRNVKLKGDLILAATADEEKGGNDGAGWLVRNHLQKVQADYVINEGGGLAVPTDSGPLYTIQTAEKGILWLRIKARGTPGHGSIPGASDNAILRMNKVLSKIVGYHPKIIMTPTVTEYLTSIAAGDKAKRKELRSLLKNPAVADEMLDVIAKKDKFLAEEMRVKLRMTITPTMVHGGVKENVIPSECEAVFDCRVLPGQTPTEALETIKNLLSEVDLDKLEFETIEANEPSESPLHTPLYEQIASVLKEFDPDCHVAPDMLTGGTDSRFFRRLGIVCYGFQPMQADVPYGEIKKGMHGIDEKISLDNLAFGTNVLYSVVEKFLT
jgi:acetylornithine deacetylase/succinyl-diaminopimelate desuccinylase-like protein